MYTFPCLYSFMFTSLKGTNTWNQISRAAADYSHTISPTCPPIRRLFIPALPPSVPVGVHYFFPPSSVSTFTSLKPLVPPTSSRRGAFSVFQKVWLSRHLSRGVGTVTSRVCVCVFPHMPALCSDVSSGLRLKINYIFSRFAFLKRCFGEGSLADAHWRLIGRDDQITRIN